VLFTTAAPLSAQDPGQGRLIGQIVTDDTTPLAQARVRVIGRTGMLLSGTDGRFAFPAVQAGDQVLEVRLLGYIAFVQWVKIEPGQTLNVRIVLSAAPVPLKAIEVKGEPVTTVVLQGFQNRRVHNNGHFFTRTDIAKMQPRVFTDVLRRVPGLALLPASGSFGSNDMVRTNRSTGINGPRSCPVLFFVNGMPLQVAGDMSIDQYVAPEDVVAVEVYTGTSQIPSEFQSALLNSKCGVIVIWTRTGDDSEDSLPPPPPQPPPTTSTNLDQP
jgi:hypothetical protein